MLLMIGGGVGGWGARLLLQFVLWLSGVCKAQVYVVNLLCLCVCLSSWIALFSHTAHIHRLLPEIIGQSLTDNNAQHTIALNTCSLE